MFRLDLKGKILLLLGTIIFSHPHSVLAEVNATAKLISTDGQVIDLTLGTSEIPPVAGIQNLSISLNDSEGINHLSTYIEYGLEAPHRTCPSQSLAVRYPNVNEPAIFYAYLNNWDTYLYPQGLALIRFTYYTSSGEFRSHKYRINLNNEPDLTAPIIEYYPSFASTPLTPGNYSFQMIATDDRAQGSVFATLNGRYLCGIGSPDPKYPVYTNSPIKLNCPFEILRKERGSELTLSLWAFDVSGNKTVKNIPIKVIAPTKQAR